MCNEHDFFQYSVCHLVYYGKTNTRQSAQAIYAVFHFVLWFNWGTFCIRFWICAHIPCFTNEAKKIPATPAELRHNFIWVNRGWNLGQRGKWFMMWSTDVSTLKCQPVSFLKTVLWPRRRHVDSFKLTCYKTVFRHFKLFNLPIKTLQSGFGCDTMKIFVF